MLDQATLNAGVAEAHKHGMLTVAHVPAVEATRMAVDAGIDGLVHLFREPHPDQIIELIADSGAFVVPCAVVDASLMGSTGAELAADPREPRAGAPTCCWWTATRPSASTTP
jgi:imidazolonepropionase-like amidohydrolase